MAGGSGWGPSLRIRGFDRRDEEAVIALWQRCDLLRPSNDPQQDVKRKMRAQPDLFLIGEVENTIVASVMAGYEGHRGWIDYLAVDPDHRHRGIGRQILSEAEEMLRGTGCPKVNLQVRTANHSALEFYRRVGYVPDDVVSLGKRLVVDPPVV